jgi:hypothetical protein
VSEMLWCDRGNHPFNANDPEATCWTEKQSFKDQQDGRKPQRTDICGPCQVKSSGVDVVKELLGPERNKRSPAEVAEARGYDPDYVKWLEDQADKA